MKKIMPIMLIAILIISLILPGCSQKLEVKNSALLEFPGVEWGMTVDQVKEALDIKNEQILLDLEHEYELDTKRTHDERTLYVKDLNVFGCKITLADFTFIRVTGGNSDFEYLGNTGGEFVLQGVRVFLADDTDMTKLEQNMTQIYGEGIGGVYSYIDSLSSGNPNKTSINANPQVRAFNKRGNVFHEALNASDYKEQMWICTNPNVIADSMLMYFTDMLKNNGHNDEDITKWLSQTPWVTLRFANNNYDAICLENGKSESKYAEYITRNTLEYRTSIYVAIAKYAALQDRNTK